MKILSNKRQIGEDFEDYRERLRAEQLYIAQRLKGRNIWNVLEDGRYCRKDHGREKLRRDRFRRIGLKKDRFRSRRIT